MKYSNSSLIPSLLSRNSIYSHLLDNSQKAMLSLYFNSSFLAKPCKLQIYFTHDCTTSQCFPKSTETGFNLPTSHLYTFFCKLCQPFEHFPVHHYLDHHHLILN